MRPASIVVALVLAMPVVLGMGVVLGVGVAVAGPALPSETPAKFTETHDGYDYTRREVEIAMRDGVKLHTVILVPKGAKRAPMLLTRTPYDADKMTGHADSAHLGPILQGYDNATDVIVEG